MTKLLYTIVIILFQLPVSAQHAPDTVEIELASSSKVVFTIGDRKDIAQLRHYDFQALFDDIFLQLDTVEQSNVTQTDEFNNLEIEEREEIVEYVEEKPYPRHQFTVNWELGMNNYFENGFFSEPETTNYTVRPWGSWATGFNGIYRLGLSKNFYVETGLGWNVYNFKFEKDDILITETDQGIVFERDPRDANFIKSKLTVTYLRASLIPMFDIGRPKTYCDECFWQYKFRIGIGPYIGHRLGSFAKQRLSIDGDKQNEINRGRLELSNFRYGVRLQVGIEGTEFFYDIDLNTLFLKDRGPEVHAWSFGFIF